MMEKTFFMLQGEVKAGLGAAVLAQQRRRCSNRAKASFLVLSLQVDFIMYDSTPWDIDHGIPVQGKYRRGLNDQEFQLAVNQAREQGGIVGNIRAGK
jgi:hypothetical protein